jgi:signal peptidase II
MQPEKRPTSWLWGHLSRDGLTAALMVVLLDQASKLWLLFGYGLAGRGRVPVLPFFDLVLTRNRGISYGMFQQHGMLGQYVLAVLSVLAAILLWVWLARAADRLTAISLGLIIGGALGNAVDRLAYGAVVDFVLLHLTTAGFSLNWYVFNLADAAIVAGVVGLLYESLWGGRAAKVP